MSEKIKQFEVSSDTWRPEELGLVWPPVRFKDVREVDRMIADKNQHDAPESPNSKKEQAAAVLVLIAILTLIVASPYFEPNYQKRLGLTSAPTITPTTRILNSESPASSTPVLVFSSTPQP